jgi:uncharacterized protein (DUF433 family)
MHPKDLSAQFPQLERITIDPRIMRGKPCIRGIRITVGTINGLLAAGETPAGVLALYPSLERQDIEAALAYAQRGGARCAPHPREAE